MRSTGSPNSRRRRGIVCAAILAALGLAVAGCGSSSSSTSSNASGSATSAAGLQQAQAYYHAHSHPPTSLGLPAVTKPIPTGKTVSFVHCGVAACNRIQSALTKEAPILGWKVAVVPTTGAPASVKAGWDTVVRLHPVAAFGSGFNHTLFASELAQLNSMHVPVLQWTTEDSVGNGIVFVKGGPSDVLPVVGPEMASWVVSSAQGKANTLYVDLPTFTILAPVKKGFDSAYAKWCPGCKLDTLAVPLTAIGSTAPSLIVSYLRAHPDVNRIAISYDGVAVGLPAALKSAGLAGKVQFIGESPSETNLAYVQNGTEAATVASPTYETWAVFLDAAARELTGQSLAPDVAWKLPYWIVTKQNFSSGTGTAPVVPNLNAELKKIWLK